ncbi:MAG TPA: tRNA pseudouridine(38-40) synthase TruA [Blastocatellia bacterium]|nr:tRNA pseudouridine(38-40) synthase TruA [Blastocatellia bacterium]
MNYRITLAYDGTDYCGWQLQAHQSTIQSELNRALERLEGMPVSTQAAGRTDTGVHAEGQVVSFRLSTQWEGSNLRRAINGNLPFDIRVLEASAADENFQARFDAKGKTYRYQIYQGEVMNPLLARYAWHYAYDLDHDRLREESRGLVGTHDFTAFTVAACDTQSRVRTVTDVRWEPAGNLIRIFFSGDGFLRYQVRTMVTALLDISRGRLKAQTIGELIAGADRSLIGAPAPARGLTLMKVEY